MPLPVQWAADFTVRGGAMELVGRHRECAVLGRLIEAVRAGESRALVVSGEAGVGSYGALYAAMFLVLLAVSLAGLAARYRKAAAL